VVKRLTAPKPTIIPINKGIMRGGQAVGSPRAR
jgi:hypothetical protein